MVSRVLDARRSYRATDCPSFSIIKIKNKLLAAIYGVPGALKNALNWCVNPRLALLRCRFFRFDGHPRQSGICALHDVLPWTVNF